MRNLFYLVFLLVLFGCNVSSNYPTALNQAQQLMQSDPASALKKLNEIDLTELHDSAVLARWALLYSEAMVINKLSAPTDTIIDIAVDYYGSHNLKDDFQKASHLKALIRSVDDTDELATALYLQKEKEFFLYKERTKRELLTSIGIIIFLISLMVILYLRQRIKYQSIRNATLLAEASGLKNQIESNRNDIDRLELKLHRLLDNRFTLIDQLCQTYYESKGTKTERKAIIEKVKNEIESVRTDSFSQMEDAVNDCRDNLLVRVCENYPEIKADDYKLLVYLASGLSTRTICLLLDESVEVVYKRKSRLKSRLKCYVEPSDPDVMSVF